MRLCRHVLAFAVVALVILAQGCATRNTASSTESHNVYLTYQISYQLFGHLCDEEGNGLPGVDVLLLTYLESDHGTQPASRLLGESGVDGDFTFDVSYGECITVKATGNGSEAMIEDAVAEVERGNYQPHEYILLFVKDGFEPASKRLPNETDSGGDAARRIDCGDITICRAQ
ncbi:MAG: hypothetical protein AMXMBFR84_30420 [Candidatus Hydrogenedentota bacterium]